LVEGVPIGLGEEGQTVGVLGDGIEAAGVGFFVEVGGFELVEEEFCFSRNASYSSVAMFIRVNICSSSFLAFRMSIVIWFLLEKKGWN